MWLCLCGALFWWAPRAEELPAVGPDEDAIFERQQELARRDAVVWREVYGDRTLPWDEARGHLAIVIDDVGRELLYTERLMSLPYPLTFSLVPDGRYSAGTQARLLQDHRRPREIMLHLPMEPLRAELMRAGDERRERFVRVGDPEHTLRETLARAWGKVPHAVGFNNHMGSAFTADRAGMTAVLEQARRSGARFFLDSRTTALTVGEQVARELGMLTGARHVFLDHDPSPAAVRQALEAAVERASESPTVVIAHPSAAVVAALETGLPLALARGVSVYPVSQVLSQLERPQGPPSSASNDDAAAEEAPRTPPGSALTPL